MIRRQRRYVSERDTVRDIKRLLEADNHLNNPYESLEYGSDDSNMSKKDKALSLVGDIIESAREISSLVTFDGAAPSKKEVSRLIGILNEMLNVEKKMRKEVGEDEIIPLK